METIRTTLSLVAEDPRLQALLVILLSVLLARLADWFLTRFIRRFTSRTPTEIDDQVIGLLHRPIFLSVVLIGFGIAVRLLQPSDPFDWIAASLFKTLATLIWLVFTIRLVRLLLSWMTRREDRFLLVQPPTLPLFDIAAKLVLIGGGAYFILISWGVNIGAWLASAGIIGIALGLAAQETLANLFAGVSILTDAPYKIGDYIVIDGGLRGKVTRIGLRSTRILTRDALEITIPNSIIGNSRIINESGGPTPKQRLRIPVGVAYGSDVDQVVDLLVRVVREEQLICADPEPRVNFIGFGESSLNFEIRCWIEDAELRGQAISAVNTAVYKALGQAGIEIPYPKRDLYIKEFPGAFPKKN